MHLGNGVGPPRIQLRGHSGVFDGDNHLPGLRDALRHRGIFSTGRPQGPVQQMRPCLDGEADSRAAGAGCAATARSFACAASITGRAAAFGTTRAAAAANATAGLDRRFERHGRNAAAAAA